MGVAGDLKRIPGAGRDPLIRPVLVSSGDQPRKPVMAPATAKEAAEVTGDAPQAASLQMSFDLLDRATKGLTFFAQRHKLLEDHIKQLEAWSNARVQTAEEAVEHWKAAAAASERKLEELQRNMHVARQRAEAAEATMQRERATLSTLQDRISAAFGAESEVNDVMLSLDMG